MARQAAQLCGQPLKELTLHSGTDASDLLGGFEQCTAPLSGQVCAGLPSLSGSAAAANAIFRTD